MGKFWKRVFVDWWSLFKSNILVGNIVLPAIAFGVTANAFGFDKALKEIAPVGFALVAALAFAFFQFLWVLYFTPRNIERDRADELQAQLRDLESGARLPEVLLRTLSDNHSNTDVLNQQLITISIVIEQYRRLFSSALSRTDDHGDLRLIADSLCNDTGEILPKLPFRPQQTINWLIGWNTYRYLFDVPKSKDPDVSFKDLPVGVSARVFGANKIRFDAEFHHGPTNNQDPVPPQSAFVNARLR